MINIGTKEYFESLKDFETHFPEDDIELITLKAHLLIERLLDKYLALNLQNINKLKKARLNFSQKVAIVSAMHHDTNCDWLWSNIKLLNKLRNELSHNLEFESYEEIQKKLITNVRTSPEFHEQAPENNYDQFRLAIYNIYDSLSCRVNL